MITLHCVACERPITTAPEIKLRICTHCHDLLKAKDSYAGICWNCDRITLIGQIPRSLKGILNEKYLFTKQCSKCTGNQEDDIAWVTFSKFKPNHQLTVTEEGKLIRTASRTIGINKKSQPRKADS